MQALVSTPPTAIIRTLPIPNPGPLELLIRVHAVALNPVDALYVAHPIRQSDQEIDRVVGSDFAGEVVSLGDKVASSEWKVGERVAGLVQGGTCFLLA